ncbi:MAG: LPS export ABC transporter periplasmic protein LptC [Burkholderiaceae bacterium]
MRERGTLVLSIVLIGGLAVGSYWLAQQAHLSDAPARKVGHDIDYTAKDITLTKMDETGRAQYVVDAAALVHYADDDSGELTQPRLVGAKVDRPEMRVRADLGKTTGDGEELRLYGNVVLVRQAFKGAQELVAKGPYMLALPDREILSSDQPIEVVQGGSRVNANGMQYDNGHRTLQLDGGKGGRIRAVIEARSVRADTRAVTPPTK